MLKMVGLFETPFLLILLIVILLIPLGSFSLGSKG